jgi:hypothetical protein
MLGTASKGNESSAPIMRCLRFAILRVEQSSRISLAETLCCLDGCLYGGCGWRRGEDRQRRNVISAWTDFGAAKSQRFCAIDNPLFGLAIIWDLFNSHYHFVASASLSISPSFYLPLNEALASAFRGAIAPANSRHEVPLDPRERTHRVYHCCYTHCACMWHERMCFGMIARALADLFVQYAYSAWAPQFAQRLRLSSTESNLIVRRRRRLLESITHMYRALLVTLECMHAAFQRGFLWMQEVHDGELGLA